MDVEGVELTNNAAERALRHAVIWQKLSFDTQSAVRQPLRRADADGYRNLPPTGSQRLAWLTEAVRAKFAGEAGPTRAAV